MKKENNKGITLIALVITIIIMLILVVVTINVSTEGGLIGKAKYAKDQTNEVKNDENYLLDDKFADKIDEAVSGKVKYKDEISGLPEGETSIPQEELSGDLKDAADKGKIVAVIEEGQNLAPIPNGFAISDENGEKTISTGLVVKDDKGNEFVWVPVQDINDMATKEGENWSGKLYDIDNREYIGKEPYALVGATSEPSERANGITQELMQSTFNDMVESVSKYGGFYVGRYETTNMDSNKITVKSGLQDGISNQTWYAMYEKSKTLTTNYIQSEMMWGCQWDAMLNWMLTGSQASKVTQNTNGNHSGDIVNTGSTTTDVINNIYDLEGNIYEMTQEAEGSNSRVGRGGRV